MTNNMLLFVLSLTSTEDICLITQASISRMSVHYAMLSKNFNQHAEHASLKFVEIICTLFVPVWPDFMRYFTPVQSIIGTIQFRMENSGNNLFYKKNCLIFCVSLNLKQKEKFFLAVVSYSQIVGIENVVSKTPDNCFLIYLVNHYLKSFSLKCFYISIKNKK